MLVSQYTTDQIPEKNTEDLLGLSEVKTNRSSRRSIMEKRLRKRRGQVNLLRRWGTNVFAADGDEWRKYRGQRLIRNCEF